MNKKLIGIGIIGLGALALGSGVIQADRGAGGDGGIPSYESKKEQGTTSIEDILSGLPTPASITFPSIPSASEVFQTGNRASTLPYVTQAKKQPFVSTTTSYGATAGFSGGGAGGGKWDESVAGGTTKVKNPFVDALGFLFGLTPIGATASLVGAGGDIIENTFGTGVTKKDSAGEKMIATAVSDFEPPEYQPGVSTRAMAPKKLGEGARSVRTNVYGEVYGGVLGASPWVPYQKDVTAIYPEGHSQAGQEYGVYGSSAYHMTTPSGTMLSGSKKDVSYLATSQDAPAVAFRKRYGGD